jgi:hypothetical protein
MQGCGGERRTGDIHASTAVKNELGHLPRMSPRMPRLRSSSRAVAYMLSILLRNRFGGLNRPMTFFKRFLRFKNCWFDCPCTRKMMGFLNRQQEKNPEKKNRGKPFKSSHTFLRRTRGLNALEKSNPQHKTSKVKRWERVEIFATAWAVRSAGAARQSWAASLLVFKVRLPMFLRKNA